MVLTGMLRPLFLAMATLCLSSVATAAPADSERRAQASAGVTNTGIPVTASRTIRGLDRARQRNDGALVARDRISGSGAIQAGHVIIENVLSPGDSPGCINFGGDVTFSINATLLIEIGGTTACTEYDQINVANTLTLNSPTLELALINNFPPQHGDRFDVLNWGTLVGTFGSINASAAALTYPLIWDTSQLYLTGELLVDVQQIADGDLAPWNNPDGQINAADVLIATQLIVGVRAPGPLQLAHGDMNLDGTIDLPDLLLIQQVVLP